MFDREEYTSQVVVRNNNNLGIYERLLRYHLPPTQICPPTCNLQNRATSVSFVPLILLSHILRVIL
jgi:hypothetical protein